MTVALRRTPKTGHCPVFCCPRRKGSQGGISGRRTVLLDTAPWRTLRWRALRWDALRWDTSHRYAARCYALPNAQQNTSHP
jgi:hypothetical protein